MQSDILQSHRLPLGREIVMSPHHPPLILSWLASMLLFLFPAGWTLAAEKAPNVTYQWSGGLSLIGKVNIQIDDRGKTSVRIVKTNAVTLDYATQLTEQEIAGLLQIIHQSGFFTIKAGQAKPEPIDNGQSVLTIASEGQQRTLQISQYTALSTLDAFFWKVTHQAELLAPATPHAADWFQTLHLALGNREQEATILQPAAFQNVIAESLSKITEDDQSSLTLHFQALMRTTTPPEYATILQKHLPKPGTARRRAWLTVLSNSGIYGSNAAKAHLTALSPLFATELKRYDTAPATDPSETALLERLRKALKDHNYDSGPAK